MPVIYGGVTRLALSCRKGRISLPFSLYSKTKLTRKPFCVPYQSCSLSFLVTGCSERATDESEERGLFPLDLQRRGNETRTKKLRRERETDFFALNPPWVTFFTFSPSSTHVSQSTKGEEGEVLGRAKEQ